MDLSSSPRAYISAGVLLGSLILWKHGSLFCFSVGLLSSVLLGCVTYFLLRLRLSPLHSFPNTLPASLIRTRESLLSTSDQVLHDLVEEEWKPLFGHCIDSALKELLLSLTRDYILKNFGFLFKNELRIKNAINRCLWRVAESLGTRLEAIDAYKFLIGDVLKIFYRHLERTRLASTQNNGSFYIQGYLSNKGKEIRFLERLAEFLILQGFPPELRPVRSFLKEVLASYLFHPIAEILTDPDFINRKIISFVGKNRLKLSLKKRSLNYSEDLKIFKDDESYKQCIETILKSHEPEELKQIRSHMVSAIIKATAVNNLSNDRFSNNFTKYINRLMNAKNICDKRLYELGDEVPSSSGQKVFWSSLLDDSNCLSFQAIMGSAFSRRYFYSFLAEENQEDYLGFWSAVEELKEANRTLWHQLATEIFYTYVHGKDGKIKVGKGALRQMEEFLTGNTGPEVFYQVQESVSKTLEQEYYHLFLISDVCYHMIEDAHNSGISISDKSAKPSSAPAPNGKEEASRSMASLELPSVSEKKSSEEEGGTLTFSDHSTFARSHLSRINEKHQNKSQALKALKKSLKPDSKVLSLLKDELEHLNSQQKDVETHLSRTESWMERIGQWRSHCQSVKHLPGDADDFEAVLIIFVPITNANDISSSAGPTSWTLIRKGQELHNFHKEITPFVPWLKNMEVPSTPKSLFTRTPNKAGLEKTRSVVQRYMDTILNDEKLNASEAVYSFFSPSPEHLKKLGSSIGAAKNQTGLMNRFRLPDFFKSSSASGPEKNKESKEGCLSPSVNTLQFEEEEGGGGGTHRDSSEDDFFLPSLKSIKTESVAHEEDVLDSFYNLIGEVFNMKGVFKWLRKSLMTFVQITYGSTINRQLRETVNRLTSEGMVVSYIRSITKLLSKCGLSSQGNISGASKSNSEEESRSEAKKLLLLNLPDFLHSLVGQQTARSGVLRVFETLQDKTLNKHLFYEILEALVNEMYPKLAQSIYGNKNPLNTF